jgi:hypothetical protein
MWIGFAPPEIFLNWRAEGEYSRPGVVRPGRFRYNRGAIVRAGMAPRERNNFS